MISFVGQRFECRSTGCQSSPPRQCNCPISRSHGNCQLCTVLTRDFFVPCHAFHSISAMISQCFLQEISNGRDVRRRRRRRLLHLCSSSSIIWNSYMKYSYSYFCVLSSAMHILIPSGGVKMLASIVCISLSKNQIHFPFDFLPAPFPLLEPAGIVPCSGCKAAWRFDAWSMW